MQLYYICNSIWNKLYLEEHHAFEYYQLRTSTWKEKCCTLLCRENIFETKKSETLMKMILFHFVYEMKLFTLKNH